LLKISRIELDEILNNIKQKGHLHKKLIKILLEEESVYTNQGRLNKSSLSRIMNMKPKDLDSLLFDCQKEMVK
jgi:hypothetical protein